MRSKMIMKMVLMSFLMVAVSLNGFTKEKKSKVIDSSWMTTPVQVDGLSQEWNQDTFGSYKKAESDYGFMNSDNFLYVIYVFKNRRHLSSIRHSGFTIWFNTEGKKAKVYGINFKEKEVTADELIARMEEEQGPLQDTQKQQLKQRPSYFIYTGDVVDKKGNVLSKGTLEGKKEWPAFRSKPVKVGEDIHVVLEFKVPLNILGALSADYALEPGQTVKIGFEWGGLSKEVQEALAKSQAAAGVVASERAHGVATNTEVSDGTRRDPREQMAYLRKQAPKYNCWVDMKLAEEK
ncbi:MAG: hypothetical protein KAT69_04320 [Candidatus Aminicenantes bacterium]|nr:hypothetical protein [Candidatus Aminicenantes bacterium]